jgi:putative NADPH-quinone reductase
MRVHVIHAHPVETSYDRALFKTTIEALAARGHTVDPLNLYDEKFDAVLSREERLIYHEVPQNLTPAVKPYVDRLRAADAIVFVYPVWNYGPPAILKGYFDRIFLPGVTFEMRGGAASDKGELVRSLTNIRKAAFVTTYGGDRLRTMIMGDPPRRLALRWGWTVFQHRPHYLALYDMNNATSARLTGFIEKVRAAMSRF